MRIISGSAGGRNLRTVSSPGLRPAMSKTREALFSMLEARGVNWGDTSALDLFAGSGSLALECVSRGSPLAWLVDNSREACACVRANIDALDMADRCYLFERDVLRFLRGSRKVPFNIVFIDPPYRRNLLSSTLSLLSRENWLEKDALIVAEVEKELKLSSPPSLELLAQKNFGQTTLIIWKKNENCALSGNL